VRNQMTQMVSDFPVARPERRIYRRHGKVARMTEAAVTAAVAHWGVSRERVGPFGSRRGEIVVKYGRRICHLDGQRRRGRFRPGDRALGSSRSSVIHLSTGGIRGWHREGVVGARSGTSVLFTLPLLPEPARVRRRSRDWNLDALAAGRRSTELVHGARMPIAFSIAAVLQGIAITVHLLGFVVERASPVARNAVLSRGRWLTATSAQPNRPSSGCATRLASSHSPARESCVRRRHLRRHRARRAWWPGIALAATLVSIAPYCTPRKLLICSFPLIAFTGIVAGSCSRRRRISGRRPRS